MTLAIFDPEAQSEFLASCSERGKGNEFCPMVRSKSTGGACE
jgi:hypothetical protein